MQMLSLLPMTGEFHTISPLGLSDFRVDQHFAAGFQFWRRFLAKVICGAAVARCFYGFGAEIGGGSHKGTTIYPRREKQAPHLISCNQAMLLCCWLLWSVVCVFMASRAASITCCSLLCSLKAVRGIFIHIHGPFLSERESGGGGGMKKAKSMRAAAADQRLFSLHFLEKGLIDLGAAAACSFMACCCPPASLQMDGCLPFFLQNSLGFPAEAQTLAHLRPPRFYFLFCAHIFICAVCVAHSAGNTMRELEEKMTCSSVF
jgi:hypothetical protein